VVSALNRMWKVPTSETRCHDLAWVLHSCHGLHRFNGKVAQSWTTSSGAKQGSHLYCECYR
jgi:hypothetical protein